MIHCPQSERGTKTACHLLIAYAPAKVEKWEWRGPSGTKEPAQGERQASRQRQRFPPRIWATISLEAQVTRPRLLKVPLPNSPLTPQREERGNQRLFCPWGFSREEYWSGLPWPLPGDLPNPGNEPRSPTLRVNSLPSEPPGKPSQLYSSFQKSLSL